MISDRRILLLLFIFFMSVYFLAANGRFSTSMDVEVYRTVQSIVESKSFGLDEKALASRPGVDGKHYCVEGLLVMLSAVPFYLLSKLVGVSSGKLIVIMNQIFTPFGCALLYTLGRKFGHSQRTSVWLAVIFGLGTMAFVHSKYMFPEPLTVIFFLSTFYFLIRFREERHTKWAVLCGCFTGATILVRPDSFLFIFGISVGMLYLIWKKREENTQAGMSQVMKHFTSYIVPLILFFAIFGYYNYARFGKIFETGYTMARELQVVKIRYPGRLLAIDETIKGFLGMWLVPNRSIFFINPILILLLFSLKGFWKKYRFESLLLGFIFLEYVYLYSNRGPAGFPGSAAWGVRYMLPMTSFMVLPIGLLLERIFSQKRKHWRIVFILLLLVSFTIQLIGSSVNYQDVQMPAEQYFGATEARLKLTMDLEWSLLWKNIQILSMFGPRDFLFLNYMKSGHLPLWACFALPLIVLTMGISGYFLIGSIPRSFIEQERDVKSMRRKKRERKKRRKHSKKM